MNDGALARGRPQIPSLIDHLVDQQRIGRVRYDRLRRRTMPRPATPAASSAIEAGPGTDWDWTMFNTSVELVPYVSEYVPTFRPSAARVVPFQVDEPEICVLVV